MWSAAPLDDSLSFCKVGAASEGCYRDRAGRVKDHHVHSRRCSPWRSPRGQPHARLLLSCPRCSARTYSRALCSPSGFPHHTTEHTTEHPGLWGWGQSHRHCPAISRGGCGAFSGQRRGGLLPSVFCLRLMRPHHQSALGLVAESACLNCQGLWEGADGSSLIIHGLEKIIMKPLHTLLL